MKHLLDILFFRLLGLGIILHETLWTEKAEWELIVAGMCMFLMPDVLRGNAALPIKIVERLIGGKE